MQSNSNGPCRYDCECYDCECYDCAANIYTGFDFPYEGGNGFIRGSLKRTATALQRLVNTLLSNLRIP